MTRHLLATTFLTLALALSGCAPRLTGHVERALDRMAVDLDEQLVPAGQLAATAALVAENTGEFPSTPFELLGSREADATQARYLNLSALTVTPTADGVELEYILLPTREDPTDRIGRLVIMPVNGEDRYEAHVDLDRRADPDHEDRRLVLAEDEQVQVRRLDGRFVIDLDMVQDQVTDGLPLAGPAYTITFTASPGYERALPRALRDGYVVEMTAER